MKKLAQNKYASRIGFNFYQLPSRAYTFVVEFFPPTLTNVSIDCCIDGCIKQNAECLYSCERATKEEVRITPTRAISTLFDQTLSGLKAIQDPSFPLGRMPRDIISRSMESTIERSLKST